ncbi:MAG TPA: hypothetical protein VKN74_00280 [Candidatus Mcinerneyibacterium sp.]|nr:hypothetical protein [Candidatus Mcinerneyibacterium sp.]
MVKKILFIGLSLIFLFCLFSCSAKSNEPNDKIQEAVEIKLGEPVSMKIKPVKDVDWYKFKVSEKGYLKVTSSKIPEKIDPEVSFALFEEWEGKKEKFIRKNLDLPAATAIPKPGEYYIKINDKYNDDESSDDFKIKVDFIKEMDQYEPNNIPEEAKVVESGKILNIAIFPDEDREWFKINVENQGYLSVKVKKSPEKIDPMIKFVEYDEWADPKISNLKGWDKLPEACFVSKKGEYYFVISDQYDDGMSEKLFDVKIDFIEEMDKFEPNNKFSEAKEIKRGVVIQPAIFPREDNDYFKFKLTDNKKIKFIAKDYGSDIKPEVRIYEIDSENPNELKSVTGWKICPAEFELNLNKQYYLLLHDQYDDGKNQETFEFKME